MCRNIRVLHGFQPPTTREEMHAAALQYVRKVSGLNKPSAVDQERFDAAVAQIAKTTESLLASLSPRATPRTREGEREKAAARWKAREARLRRW